MSNLLVLILTTKCGLCSGAVRNGHKAVQCDRRGMWIHTECSFISDAEYGTLVNSNCSWICPKYEVLNFPLFSVTSSNWKIKIDLNLCERGKEINPQPLTQLSPVLLKD